ncbi:MFS transporter [Kutzneria buriramensis]|uniref:MFS transporter n=1 Tax=Kutzneria buriramensis TaxID=1045776 RepID=A0A3E0H0V3_9PSEU|nr:MFS transporter [Kutzneria buriramensis]REH36156.1 MFS transporter [Kutzneria buriramensis]
METPVKAPLLALLTGTTVSLAGTAMTALSIPWFVLHTTGSPAQTGLVAAAGVAGLTVSSALSGPIVDRIQPRLVSIGSDLVAAVLVGLIPTLALAGALPLWALVLVVALQGLTRAPGATAEDALLPSAARVAGVPIARASSWQEGAARTGRFLGGALVGVLIALLGPAQVLYVDSASYLVSVLMTAVFVRVHLERDEPKPWSVAGHLTELREGLSYLRGDGLLAAVVSMVMITNMLDGAYTSVLLPTFGDRVLHSSVLLGVLVGTSTAAALAGVIAYGAIGGRLPKWGTYAVAFLLAGAPRLVVMAAAPPLAVLVTTIAVTSFAFGAINPILLSQLFARVPETMRGRVFGVVSAGALAGMPVGALLGGAVVELFGLTSALLLSAALYLTVTMCPFVFRVWRRLDEPVPV